MGDYLTRRSLHSLLSLGELIVLVFFLARLTGDPTNLYLPLDASLEARAEFAEKHGSNDPLTLQFGWLRESLAPFDPVLTRHLIGQTAFDATSGRAIV